jgi:tRNA A-37 threonylcarbamoyl transferase component Bud32
VPVPELLHVDPEFIVMRFVPGAQLAELLRGDLAVVWWQRGLQFLADAHRRDQCLSQAFARNFIASGEQLVAIDFESDPRQAMSLDAAKARDWLAFLYSSMKTLPLPAERAAAMLHAAQADEPEAVRRMVADAGRRLAWVRHLRGEGPTRSWRRHISNLQAVSAAILGAEAHASRRQAAQR